KYVDGVHQRGYVLARAQDVHLLGHADFACKRAQIVLQIAAAGDDCPRMRYPFQQQRHRPDQMALTFLQREPANIAYQERAWTDPQFLTNTLALTFQSRGYRRLEPVADAAHALGVAHTARTGETGDVIRDGNDQVLSRRAAVVDQSDEWVEEKAIVVVPCRDEQRSVLAEPGNCQAGVDVGSEQVRMQNVEVAL